MAVDFVRQGQADGSTCSRPRYRQTHLAEFHTDLLKQLGTQRDILRWNKAQTWKSLELNTEKDGEGDV